MQVAIDGITYVSHDDPAWRGGQHRLAMVNLARFDLEGMLEQLWLREVGGGEGYEICCIPFYTYGLALGDVVSVDETGNISHLVRKTGRLALRVLFDALRSSLDGRDSLRGAVASAGLLSEWNGDHHVAIDMPNASVAQSLLDSIHEEIRLETAFWEWSISQEFRHS
ncbi:DUF4265 domain-containing protein [Actinacidiphila glaucinigra]|uniref:DUF4265 domain-containing protein n=1 Tax=Actinacidiphila glaucinigra TaxID=235986 RepID=UPI0036F131FE